MDFLRDPIWQFIGVAVPIMLFLVSFFVQRAKKQVTPPVNAKQILYALADSYPLVNIDKNFIKAFSEDIDFSFKGNRITGLSHVRLEIWNAGSEAIGEEEFDRPMSFKFGQAQILLAFLKSEPKDIGAKLIFLSPHEISLMPLFLNSGERIQIWMFVSEFNDLLQVDSRFKGFPQAKRFSRNEMISREKIIDFSGKKITFFALFSTLMFILMTGWVLFVFIIMSSLLIWLKVLILGIYFFTAYGYGNAIMKSLLLEIPLRNILKVGFTSEKNFERELGESEPKTENNTTLPRNNET